MRRDSLELNTLCVTPFAPFDFGDSILETFPADDDSQGNADEFGILELKSGAGTELSTCASNVVGT